MLTERGRLDPGAPCGEFLDLMIAARSLRVLPISPRVAALLAGLGRHRDPADRLIAATALAHSALLVTADQRLREDPDLRCTW